ncbi:hypothetical protein ACQJBY_005131 [Aegilops geniculata]
MGVNPRRHQQPKQNKALSETTSWRGRQLASIRVNLEACMIFMEDKQRSIPREIMPCATSLIRGTALSLAMDHTASPLLVLSTICRHHSIYIQETVIHPHAGCACDLGIGTPGDGKRLAPVTVRREPA